MSSIETTDTESPLEDAVLRVRDLNVTYDMSAGLSRVIDSVDIDIYRDEILGVIGESGSGKSMFASSLLDAVPKPGSVEGRITYYPEEGDSIDVLGLDDEELKQFRWEHIAMVFQGAMSSFNPTMKIRGHFEETIDAHDMDMIEQMRHAYSLLDSLHLDAERVMESYPHELSGGMKQRALIALSLVLEPNVLVMDEPTAALDLLMQRSITNLLLDLQQEYDLTILFITHDLPLIAGLVDRLAVMYAFQFVEVGEKRDVLLDAGHPYTRLLLQAVPNMDTPTDQMEPIEGKSPDPTNVPSGCSFHPRCPLSDDRCQMEDPPPQGVGEDHWAACFYCEESKNTIKYKITDEDSK